MAIDLDDVDFERLIGDRDIDICELIEKMNGDGIARALYYYALFTIKGRWPEAEPYIKKDSHWAYCYAKYVIRDRWPEAEPHIKKDPEWAHRYSCRFGVEL